MVLTKYNESICKIYINQSLKYLDDIDNINFVNNKNLLIFQGFNCLNKILMIVYALEMSEEQINSYLEKAHMLYIEYTEQVFLKNEDVIHSPSMFVYNVLIGNISFESMKSNKEQFSLYLTKWSFLLTFWDSNFTINERKYFIENFFNSYLLLFTNADLFELHKPFEIVQEYLKGLNNSFDVYSMFLSSFHNYFENNDSIFTKQDIEKLCFEKFLRHKDYFELELSKVETKKQMDTLVHWIFN